MNLEDQLKQIAFRVQIPVLNTVQIIAVIAAAWLSASLTWNFFGNDGIHLVSAVPQKGKTAAQSVNSSSNESVNTGKALKLFGEYQQPQITEEPLDVDAPVTNLKFSLQGVFASSDPNLGSAIISNASGESLFVSQGDDIFGQAVLSRVFADRVILDRQGLLETLYFEEIDPSVAVVRSQGSSQNSNSSQSGLGPSTPDVRIDDKSLLTGSASEVISNLRELAYSNPESLIDRMGLEVSESGYQVTRRARQLLFLGLRPGDTIVSVNDTGVGDVQQDVALIDQVLSGGEVKIEIQRGNRRFSIYQAIPQ